jgi:hypothetical protein
MHDRVKNFDTENRVSPHARDPVENLFADFENFIPKLRHAKHIRKADLQTCIDVFCDELTMHQMDGHRVDRHRFHDMAKRARVAFAKNRLSRFRKDNVFYNEELIDRTKKEIVTLFRESGDVRSFRAHKEMIRQAHRRACTIAGHNNLRYLEETVAYHRMRQTSRPIDLSENVTQVLRFFRKASQITAQGELADPKLQGRLNEAVRRCRNEPAAPPSAPVP